MFRDGPLTRRAPETIRYGTGRCALGALLVASSDKGIVSIMVRDTPTRAIRDLGARFPKANLVRDEKGSKATVAKVARYIAAPFRPFALPLDIRGTDLQQCVWREVRRIPFGETSTYAKNRRGDRRAEGDPRGRPVLLTELVRFRGALPSGTAHRALAGGPAVRLGRLRGDARREAAKVEFAPVCSVANIEDTLGPALCPIPDISA